MNAQHSYELLRGCLNTMVTLNPSIICSGFKVTLVKIKTLVPESGSLPRDREEFFGISSLFVVPSGSFCFFPVFGNSSVIVGAFSFSGSS